MPSDSTIPPSVAALSKSFCHATDKRRAKAEKSLSFGEILPKSNPVPDQLTMVLPVLPIQDVPDVIPDVPFEGNICQVQVSAN